MKVHTPPIKDAYEWKSDKVRARFVFTAVLPLLHHSYEYVLYARVCNILPGAWHISLCIFRIALPFFSFWVVGETYLSPRLDT